MAFQLVEALQQSQEFLEPLVEVTYQACHRLFATIKLRARTDNESPRHNPALLIAGPGLWPGSLFLWRITHGRANGATLRSIPECCKRRLVALAHAHLAPSSPCACEFSRACPATRATIKVSIRAFSATFGYAVADANILATVGLLLPDTGRRCSGFQQAPTLALLQDALQQAGCEPIVTISIYLAPLRDEPTASLRDQRCQVNCAGADRTDGGAGVPAPWRYIGQIFAIEVPAVEALLTSVIEHDPPAALGLLHSGGVGAEHWSGAARR